MRVVPDPPHDLDTRRARFGEWLDGHRCRLEPTSPALVDELAPWLLVQSNVWDQQLHASTHESPTTAAEAFLAQPQAEDWRIVELVNLDNGRRLVAEGAIRWRVA